MRKIVIISDTHSYLDEKILNFINDCDEVWHAGDLGDIRVLDQLRALKPLRAVYGNVDGHDIRCQLKEIEDFTVEGMRIVMKHIGGYPKKYEKPILEIMQKNPPNIFISGHSHILKVIYDEKYNCLHMNPGACGNYGIHTVKTALRFVIEGHNVRDLEILEVKR